MMIGGAELQGIVWYFEEIDDPRSEINRRHLLVDVIRDFHSGRYRGSRWTVGHCHVGKDAGAVAARASRIAQWHSFPAYHWTSSTIVEASGVSAMFCSMVGLASRIAIRSRYGGEREASPTNCVGWKVFAAFTRTWSRLGSDVFGKCLGNGPRNCFGATCRGGEI